MFTVYYVVCTACFRPFPHRSVCTYELYSFFSSVIFRTPLQHLRSGTKKELQLRTDGDGHFPSRPYRSYTTVFVGFVVLDDVDSLCMATLIVHFHVCLCPRGNSPPAVFYIFSVFCVCMHSSNNLQGIPAEVHMG